MAFCHKSGSFFFFTCGIVVIIEECFPNDIYGLDLQKPLSFFLALYILLQNAE